MTREGTTRTLIDLIEQAKVRWAVLHGAEYLAEGSSIPSDVDIVAGIDLPTVLVLIREELANRGLIPLVLNQYDVGRADAVWLMDRNDGSVLEFDVLSDPRGIGRLGIPMDCVLGEPLGRINGAWTVEGEWSVAYRVSKRLWKRQWERLLEIDLSECEPRILTDRLTEVFGRRSALRIRRLLDRDAQPKQWRKHRLGIWTGRFMARVRRARYGIAGLVFERLKRVKTRLKHPVGAWVHFAGTEAQPMAEACFLEISRTLPNSLLAPASSGLSRVALLWRIANVVIRPGLAVTWAESTVAWLMAEPHLAVATNADSDWLELRDLVGGAMSARIWKFLQ